jgi:hypothetical protein
MNINLYLIYLSIFLGIIPLLSIILIKNKNISFKLLLFYLCYSLISDLILTKLSIKYLQSEIYSFRLFTIVEYFSITYILYCQIESIIFRKFIKFSSLVFSFFILLDIFTNPLNEFDSIPTGIESLLILITSLLLLYEKILKSNKYFTAFVWISIGLILFFAGTFFLFIMSQNNYSDRDFNDTYGYIVAIFKILMYSFFFVGIISEIKSTNLRSTKI